MAGVVYLLSNSAAPGIYKVGQTSRNPKVRVAELNAQTGAPGRWVCEYTWSVDDPELSEKLAHIALKEFHHSKEYFKVPISEAVKVIESVIGEEAAYNREQYKQRKAIERQQAELHRAIKVSESDIERKKISLENTREYGPDFGRGYYVAAVILATIIIPPLIHKTTEEDYVTVFLFVGFMLYMVYQNKKPAKQKAYDNTLRIKKLDLLDAMRNHPHYTAPPVTNTKTKAEAETPHPVPVLSRKDRARISQQTKIFMKKNTD